MKTSYKDNL